MKHIISIVLVILASSGFLWAQNITNVRTHQEGENIIITYDLAKQSDVRVFVTTGQSTQYTELKAVTGAVGKDISAGTDLQIIWQPLKEQTEFVAQNVRFKIEARLIYYFSVSATRKVSFSSGNLQYRASTNTWRFASYQYDYIGAANKSISKTYNGWIDLFGWSGSTGSAIWGVSTSQSNSDYSGDFVDWGKNIIGMDITNSWRTLTYDEWYYLRNTRTNANNLIGIARIQLGENEYVNGLILLPDNWNCPTYVTFKSGSSGENSVLAYADYQTFKLSDWQKLEAAGAVFLPASGLRNGARDGQRVYHIQFSGHYWSATLLDSGYAGEFNFYSIRAYCGYNYRCSGYAVRLVRDL